MRTRRLKKDGRNGVSDFYLDAMRSLKIDSGARVLVVCAGSYDASVLKSCGIENGVISNLDYHGGVKDYGQYAWEYQDAEQLSFENGSFDWVVVNAGLHHCASPHRALCEMLRVARKGVLVVEARDSLLLRASVRLGLTADYEVEPVLLSGGKLGGYRNTHIPNYVYRWTEREFEKTVRSFVPHEQVQIRFLYGYALPLQRMAMSRNPLKRAVVRLLDNMRFILEKVAPKQGNRFAMILERTGTPQPWLKVGADGIEADLDHMKSSKGYDPEKYREGVL